MHGTVLMPPYAGDTIMTHGGSIKKIQTGCQWNVYHVSGPELYELFERALENLTFIPRMTDLNNTNQLIITIQIENNLILLDGNVLKFTLDHTSQIRLIR